MSDDPEVKALVVAEWGCWRVVRQDVPGEKQPASVIERVRYDAMGMAAWVRLADEEEMADAMRALARHLVRGTKTLEDSP